MKKLFETDPCYNEFNRPYVKEQHFESQLYRAEIRNYWALLESCNAEIAKESVVLPECEDEVNVGKSVVFNGLYMALLLCVTYYLSN